MSDDLSGNPSDNYVDGATAEAAFDKLVARGLFNDAKVAPAAAGTPAPAPEPTPTPTPTPEAVQPAQEPEYANLDDYLTKSELDRAAFLELPVTVKVDGKTTEVPLSTLLRTYQTDAHVTQKSQQLAEQQRNWESEQTQARQALQTHLAQAQALATLAHQQALAEFQNVDWNGLYAQDPGRFAAEQQRYQMRVGQIQGHLSQIAQAQLQQQQQQQEVLASKVLPAERERMFEAFPTWRDPQKFQAATAEIRGYAKSEGYTDAELSSVFDHRYMKTLYKASLYDALQAKNPAVLKIVRASPPMAAPGARIQRDPKGARLQQVREAGRTGKLARNEDAQAAAFSALVDAGA